MQRVRVPIPGPEWLQMHRGTKPEPWPQQIPIDTRWLNRYPDVEAFRARVAQYIDMAPECILITSGVEGALKAIYETYQPKTVYYDRPCWAMYDIFAAAYGAKLEINQPDLRIITNPGAPVETVYDQEWILARATENNIVVVDEAYWGFGAPTMVQTITDNLVVMRSFSKSFGLPGIRLGWLVGTPAMVAKLEEKRLAYETNSLSLAVGMWALDHDRSVFQPWRDSLARSRDMLRPYGAIGSCSNTVILPVSAEKLRAHGILAKPMATGVQVALGTPETTQKLVEAINAIT